MWKKKRYMILKFKNVTKIYKRNEETNKSNRRLLSRPTIPLDMVPSSIRFDVYTHPQILGMFNTCANLKHVECSH